MRFHRTRCMYLHKLINHIAVRYTLYTYVRAILLLRNFPYTLPPSDQLIPLRTSQASQLVRFSSHLSFLPRRRQTIPKRKLMIEISSSFAKTDRLITIMKTSFSSTFVTYRIRNRTCLYAIRITYTGEREKNPTRTDQIKTRQKGVELIIFEYSPSTREKKENNTLPYIYTLQKSYRRSEGKRGGKKRRQINRSTREHLVFQFNTSKPLENFRQRSSFIICVGTRE